MGDARVIIARRHWGRGGVGDVSVGGCGGEVVVVVVNAGGGWSSWGGHHGVVVMVVNMGGGWPFVEVTCAPGAIRRRSAHKYAVPSNHM